MLKCLRCHRREYHATCQNLHTSSSKAASTIVRARIHSAGLLFENLEQHSMVGTLSTIRWHASISQALLLSNEAARPLLQRHNTQKPDNQFSYCLSR